MKKIPIATSIIVLFSLILFGLFIVNYKSYTEDLDYQFESQASNKLSKINGTKRETIDLRLENHMQKMKLLCEKIKDRDPGYEPNKFLESADDMTVPKLYSTTIGGADGLSPFNVHKYLNDRYYTQLSNLQGVISYGPNGIVIIYPYQVNSKSIEVLYQTYSLEEFSDFMAIGKMEYGGTTYLINEAGDIYASDISKYINKNLFEKLRQSVFKGKHTFDGFVSNLSSGKSSITHYKMDDIDTYAYYSPTTIKGIYLLHTAPSNILDRDSEAINTIAKRFMNTVLVIVFLLVMVVFLVLSVYTLKVNKNRDVLLLEKQRYQIALSHSKDTIWEYNIEKDVLTKTEPYLGIFYGVPEVYDIRNAIVTKDLIHPDDKDIFLEFCDKLISKDAQFEFEVRSKNPEGDYVWYELSGTKLFDPDGKPISVIGQTTNIHEKKKEIELLLKRASQDTLTKTYNRETVREKINQRIEGLEEPYIFGLMIIDIDNFKMINDTLGHLFGDAVLIDLSAKLIKLFEEEDLIGRIGGDEFVVFVHNAPSITYLEEKAKQTLSLLHDIHIGEEATAKLTGTIGISIYPSDGTTYNELLEKAEIALYHAKQRGKDQYSFYHSSMEFIYKKDLEKISQETKEIKYHYEDRSLVDSTIIANAIEILFDSREIDVSINMMLSLIGVYYNLSRIDIMEFSESDHSVSITHEWYSDSSLKLADLISQVPYTELEPTFLYQEIDSGIIHFDDISERPEVIRIFSQYPGMAEAKSLFQCGISDHGHYVGFLSAAFCEEAHTWSKNEVDSLSLISKVIGSYLIRLRSLQKVNLDTLTNSYNFNAFLDEVNKQLKQKTQTSYAMFYTDINQFKLMNDNFGYQEGDYILKTFADSLLQIGDTNSILCRITGDKFALFLAYEDLDDLTNRALKLQAVSKQVCSPSGEFYKLSVRTGIYQIQPGDTAIVAVDRANIARKYAQLQRNGNFEFYNDEMRVSLIEQKKIEDVMEDALQNGEFLVYYQPKINITTKKICGAEALVRWMRPEVGLVSPASFIPIFEANGFIVNLDYYVLDRVCNRLRELIDQGFSVYPVSVNFSREHFKSDALPERLRQTIQKYQLPPELIEVEITESALASNDRYWLNLLNKIRSYGFGLAMDDFGSGMSSLNLLCDLPFKVLKIDKDFFHTKTTNIRERIVISSIVTMASQLDMDVICEGVETEDQIKFLQSIGCTMAQGYYYDKPLPSDVYEEKYLT